MARIRSVHPGLFTDEAFASCSPAAQILLIGIWTESDDNGIFEWKPVTLKMRVMPTHNVDVVPLLAELEAHNIIKRYEHDGRQLAAVRNFTRYQRPKKPKSVHFMPPEFRTYVGLTAPSTEPDTPEAPSVPTKAEKSPQMKEEGGRKKEPSVPKKKPTGLPENWQPTAEGIAYAAQHRLSQTETSREVERFSNHHGGKGTTMVDWGKAWQNWVLKAAELLGRQPVLNGANGAAKITDWAKRIAWSNAHNGEWPESIWGDRDDVPKEFANLFAEPALDLSARPSPGTDG